MFSRQLAPFAILLLVAGGVCFSGEHPAKLDVARMMQAPDEDGNVIPDFSRAGYMGGGVALPRVPVVKELSPRAEGCDRGRIQEALDEIGGMEPCGDGFRGALLLRAGEYRIGGPLEINNSGVVLRGEGQSQDGTVIINTRRDERPWSEVRREHNSIVIGEPESLPRLGFLNKTGEKTELIDAVPVGSRRIRVRSTEGFNAGDRVLIDVRPNEKWLKALALEEYWGTAISWMYHRYERRIMDVDGNDFVLDVPMVHFIEPELFRVMNVYKFTDDLRISNSGVEHIRLVSVFSGEAPGDGRNAVNGVIINRARDSWVRNVTALHFQMSAVNIRHGARNITVQDCAYFRPASRGGAHRYAFYSGGTMSLVQRCYARDARHAFASSARRTGPNVFLDCFSERNHSDIGPHQMWDTGYLYDNISAPLGSINVQHYPHDNHRWRGVNTVLWNCEAAVISCDQPPTGDTNWSIGSIASRSPGRVREEPGVWISHGRRVEPRSLYLWQLEERIGREAVENVTVPVQRRGDAAEIRDYIKDNLLELTDREKDNRRNIFPGCPEFKDFVHPGRTRWRFTAPDEGLEMARVQVYLEKGVINRAENPVYGDDSALEVPAGVLWHWYTSAMPYPCTSAGEYSYTLEFDYKTGERGSITPRIIYTIIEYDENNRSNWRNIGSAAGPVAFGAGDWERYSSSSSFEPEYDGRGVSYRMLVRVRLEADESFLFANPRLELTGEEEQ